jgi:molybdate transport system regulatory protein
MTSANLIIRIDLRTGARIGPGKIKLLEAIRSTGSISAAARSLGMSYRRAWLLVEEINRALRKPAVQPGRATIVATVSSAAVAGATPAGVATAAIATGRTRPRPTPRRGAAGAAEAAAAGPAAAQNHAGREPVRLSFTRLRKYGRSRQSATPSRSERPCRTSGTYFCATRGTTGRGSPRSCTICSWHAMFRSGSARMTLASASRFSVLSTRAWRSRGSGSCW